MAELLHAVAVGRVRYPAGTTATPELRELIDPKHWSDTDDTEQSAAPGGVDEAQLTELRELAAHEIEVRDARIAELEEEIANLRQAFDPIGASKTAPAAPPVDYSGQGGKWLKDEIDRRNDGRDPAQVITVAPPGNKPEMVAALEADDRRASGD